MSIDTPTDDALALDGWHLQLSGTLVVALIALALAAPSAPHLHWTTTPGIQVAAAGVVTFVATRWRQQWPSDGMTNSSPRSGRWTTS
jgi:hypothetical protein